MTQAAPAHLDTGLQEEEPQELFQFTHEEAGAPSGPRSVGRHAPTRAEIAPQQEPMPTMHEESAAYMPSPAAQTNVAVAQEEAWEDDYEEEDGQPGLFKRVASRLSSREEERPRARRVEVAASNPEPEQEPQHDLEIPAFLRRQAN